MTAELDIFGQPVGTKTETIEYGQRFIRDNNDYDPYDGAYYAGGPKTFEIVQRTVTMITGKWAPADPERGG